MWPFSTLRHLRWEIEQANTANEIMRTALTRRDERLGETQHALLAVKGSLLAEENKVRELKGQLVISEHEMQRKDGVIWQINAQIVSVQSLNKALAAERDEAVLRARNVQKKLEDLCVRFDEDDVQHRSLVTVLRQQLKGALVRDPKTGRMTKWQEQPPGEAPFDFLGTGHLTAPEGPIVLLGTDDFCGETDDTVNFDRVMAGLHDTVRES